jgi:hypothetical protein
MSTEMDYIQRFKRDFTELNGWVLSISFNKSIEKIINKLDINTEYDEESHSNILSCTFNLITTAYKYKFTVEKPNDSCPRGYILCQFAPRTGLYKERLRDLCDGDYSLSDWDRILRKLISNELVLL